MISSLTLWSFRIFLKFQIYDDLLVIIFLLISVFGHYARICAPLFNFSASWPLSELVVDWRGMDPNIELLSLGLLLIQDFLTIILFTALLILQCLQINSHLFCPVLLAVLSKRLDPNYLVCHYRVQNSCWWWLNCFKTYRKNGDQKILWIERPVWIKNENFAQRIGWRGEIRWYLY